MEQQNLQAPYTMEQMEESYEKLGLENYFLFGKVMKDKSLCIQMLECLTGNEIEDVTEITVEKSFKVSNDTKGVRYDIYIADSSERIYDAEMQNLDSLSRKELPLRSRFYQGMIDLGILENGMPYTDLKDSYVIFICTSDPFDENLGCYSFSNLCHEDTALPLNDGRTILFFNTKGNLDIISDKAREFLSYIETGRISGAFSKQLDSAVRKARRNKEWRVEYMLSLLHDWDVKSAGIREGRAEGKREGAIETLISLVKDGDISIEVAAQKAGISIEEFEKLTDN